MNTPSWQYLHILIFALGLVLLVGGIAAGKPGAWIIGLVVAAVNLQLWQRSRSGQGKGKTNG
jgi:hypothetical protein